MFTFPVGFFKKSSTTVTESVNSADLNGTTHSFSLADTLDNFTDCTFLVRIKTTQATTGRLFSISSNSMIFDVRSGNTLLFAEGATAESLVDSTVFDGNWHTVGFTISGTTLKIFVDGVAGLSTTISAISSKNFQMYVGQTGTSTAYFDGSMTNVIAIREALSDAEVLDLSSTPSICYADIDTNVTDKLDVNGGYWNLGNSTSIMPSGDELLDQSGNGNNLTNVGSTPFTGTGLSVECT